MRSGWEFPDIRQGGDGPLALPGPGEAFALFYDGVAERGFLLTGVLASITGAERGLELESPRGRKRWRGNPLDHLDEAFFVAAGAAGATAYKESLGRSFPCFAGAFHYDLRRCIERYPSPAPDGLGLPWIRWLLFESARAFGGCELRALANRNIRAPAWSAGKSLDRGSFESGVRRILELELAGEVYQVNLTRRLEALYAEDPFPLWQRLAVGAKAPFSAFVDLGGFQILSLSPERLLCRRGNRAWTEPIKGTVARGLTPAEDAANLSALGAGEKEAAELAMIVDVSRNDLGRLAVPGRVSVPYHREVLSLPNVHHLVSRVEAELKPGTGVAQLLRAVFPGASVTGAPKISAMRIIDDIEPDSRGFYCGALGWMDLRGDLDWSLPIRTATAAAGGLTLGVGGGIVADSDPSAEWEETLAKARCFGL